MEKERKRIYPLESRIFVNTHTYSSIAVQNYCEAKDKYMRIQKVDYKIGYESATIREDFFNNVLICVIFSAMTIEAFINNYAAACIGDKIYVENYDHLSIISKLQLISQFILQVEFDRSKSYFSNLKDLFALRDSFIHSKSQSAEEYFKKNNYSLPHSLEELDAINMERGDYEPIYNKNSLQSEFSYAQTAMRALRDIAYFFDNVDENSTALFDFFCINGFTENVSYYKTVKEDFEIKG